MLRYDGRHLVVDNQVTTHLGNNLVELRLKLYANRTAVVEEFDDLHGRIRGTVMRHAVELEVVDRGVGGRVLVAVQATRVAFGRIQGQHLEDVARGEWGALARGIGVHAGAQAVRLAARRR